MLALFCKEITLRLSNRFEISKEGDELEDFERETTFSTSSTNLQTVISWVTDPKPIGRYRIEVWWKWSCALPVLLGNGRGRFEVYIDGVLVDGEIAVSTLNSDDVHATMVLDYINFSSVATHTIMLRARSAGTTLSIQKVKGAIWRVS